jgi:hypothetical protein
MMLFLQCSVCWAASDLGVDGELEPPVIREPLLPGNDTVSGTYNPDYRNATIRVYIEDRQSRVSRG